MASDLDDTVILQKIFITLIVTNTVLVGKENEKNCLKNHSWSLCYVRLNQSREE